MIRACQVRFWLRGMVVTVVLVAGGCERAAPEGKEKAARSGGTANLKPQSSQGEVPAALPAELFVSAEPAGARDVEAVKRDAREGEVVVVRGRVAGRRDPFVADRAILMLTDLSLPTCDMRPGDTCKTPWDYCCEPKERIAASSLTVQVAGEDGKPLKTGLAGVGGLRPGVEVVVQGRVAQKDNTALLVIDATRVFVRTGG